MIACWSGIPSRASQLRRAKVLREYLSCETWGQVGNTYGVSGGRARQLGLLAFRHLKPRLKRFDDDASISMYLKKNKSSVTLIVNQYISELQRNLEAA